jgi:hypothetical protein
MYFKVESTNYPSTWAYDLHACINFMPYETFFGVFANKTHIYKSGHDILVENGDIYYQSEHDYFRVPYYNIHTDDTFLGAFNDNNVSFCNQLPNTFSPEFDFWCPAYEQRGVPLTSFTFD